MVIIITSVTCCFEVYKNVGENQLTHYELEEFFRSLQDLLSVLSLNPNLSFGSAEFLSRRLNGFERTLSVLSSRLRVSYWSKALLSDLDTLIYCQSTKATLRGLALFRFARGGGRTTFNRQSGCCEIRCSRPPEA